MKKLLLIPLLVSMLYSHKSNVETNVAAQQPSRDYTIVIDKSDRGLDLYDGSTLIGSYKVSIGRGGEEEKQRRGDKLTPEGEFKILAKKDGKSTFPGGKMLLLNYPLPKHAERGYEMGIISKEQYDQIITAHKQGKMPPQNTPLGGLIEIHGPADKSYAERYINNNFSGLGSILGGLIDYEEVGNKIDFSSGCVVADKKTIDLLVDEIPLRTRVIIRR